MIKCKHRGTVKHVSEFMFHIHIRIFFEFDLGKANICNSEVIQMRCLEIFDMYVAF